MSRLKKGPELKPPAFLADVYWDMRDRRLLPLVALVLVAIAAVPFLLGGDPEEVVPEAPSVAAGEGGQGVSAAGAGLTVVEATPGLRDYEKRLKDRTPSDPFVQQYTTPPGGGAGGEGGSGGGDASAGGSGEPTSIPSGGAVEGDGADLPARPGGGGGEAPPLITFVADVQISRSEETAGGKRKTSEPQLRRRVRPFKPLPGKKVPVVTTMGLNLHTGKFMFLVSDEAHSLDGEFRCVARTPQGVCELLEVEPGLLFDVFYGPDKVRYGFKVTRVSAARAGRVGDGNTSSLVRKGPFGAGFAIP